MKWMMSIIIVFLLLLVGKSGMQVNDASTEVAVTSSVSTEKKHVSDSEWMFEQVNASLDQAKVLKCESVSQNAFAENFSEHFVRRIEKLNNDFLRLSIRCYSLLEENLLCEKERLYPTISFHCAVPSCEYFVFALRKIII